MTSNITSNIDTVATFMFLEVKKKTTHTTTTYVSDVPPYHF